MFQDYYLFHLVQYFKTFFLSCTKKHSLHFYSPFSTVALLLLYTHMPTAFHDISSQIHSNQKRCHIPSTFQLYLHNSNTVVPFYPDYMSRLWPKNGTCIFYLVMKAYKFDIYVRCCGFCKGCDWLWVFGCVGFWCGKVLNKCCFKNKEK